MTHNSQNNGFWQSLVVVHNSFIVGYIMRDYDILIRWYRQRHDAIATECYNNDIYYCQGNECQVFYLTCFCMLDNYSSYILESLMGLVSWLSIKHFEIQHRYHTNAILQKTSYAGLSQTKVDLKCVWGVSVCISIPTSVNFFGGLVHLNV